MFQNGRFFRLIHRFPLPKNSHSYTIHTAVTDSTSQQWRGPKHLLQICVSAQSLNQTKQAHAISILHGLLPSSVSLSAALILRYAAFQVTPVTLYSLFRQTLPYSPHSTFLYNIFIRAHGVLRLYDEGLVIYNEMVRNNVRGDRHTYPFVLKLCAECCGIQKGLETHCVLIKFGFEEDVFVNNTLMLFYGNCDDPTSVDKVFAEMPERDVVSWNTIIRVFSDKDCFLQSLDLFDEMLSNPGCMPNDVTVVSTLPACAAIRDGLTAGRIHCYALKVGLDTQVNVGNAFVDAYGKCGEIEAAKLVFDQMLEKNSFTWNAIIHSFAYVGCNGDALNTFRMMIDKGVQLDPITVSIMLPVLVELGFFNEGKEVHGFSIRSGMDVDISVINSLIHLYAKSGNYLDASNVFYSTGMRNVVSWNVMVANCAQNGFELEAIELVRKMQLHGQIPNVLTFTNVLPACARIFSVQIGKEIHAKLIRIGSSRDLFVSNALTDMYAKCGCLNSARNVFLVSPRDVVSYNTMIFGYTLINQCLDSLSLFVEMGLLGIKHNPVSFIGVLSACANISAIKQGKEIHASAIRKSFDEDLLVSNSLLDMYAKSGQISLARKLFDMISKKNSASYTTMILGLGMAGEFENAISVFESMKEEDGVDCDSVTYVAVLSACSHGGLIEEGHRYFREMLARGIEPSETHYACMIDLLGRSGLIEEDSLHILKSLPIKPDTNILGALLGVCQVHGNLELGCWAAEHLIRLEPDHSGYYVLLSNMYAGAGKWEEVDRVREMMNLRGVKKNPGCSWVQKQDWMHNSPLPTGTMGDY